MTTRQTDRSGGPVYPTGYDTRDAMGEPVHCIAEGETRRQAIARGIHERVIARSVWSMSNGDTISPDQWKRTMTAVAQASWIAADALLAAENAPKPMTQIGGVPRGRPDVEARNEDAEVDLLREKLEREAREEDGDEE